jgi:hypothetical protein
MSNIGFTDFVAMQLASKPARATVVSTVAIASNIAKVEIDIFPRGADRSKVTAAVMSALGNTATPISDSFIWQDDEKTRAVGYVTASRELRQATADNMQHMVSVARASRTVATAAAGQSDATNVFMDERDKSLWKMNDGPNGRFLTKAANDDFNALLKECAHRQATTLSPKHLFSVTASVADDKPQLGDYVTYVTPVRSPVVSSGIVVAHRSTGGVEIMSASGDSEIIPPNLVIAGHSTRSFTTTASALDLSLPIKEYYKKAFSLPDMQDYVAKIHEQIGDAIAA